MYLNLQSSTNMIINYFRKL